MNMIFQETPGFPAFKDADGGKVLPSVQKFMTQYIEQGKYTPEFDAYFDSARAIMNDYLFGNIQEVTTGKSAADALTDWNAKFEQFMKEKGSRGLLARFQTEEHEAGRNSSCGPPGRKGN